MPRADAAPFHALLATALLLCCALTEPAVAGETCDGIAVGDPLTLGVETPIGELLDRASERVGERVLVAGEVADVCQAAGCWLELRAGDGERTLKVKVDDGVIVFPRWSRGKRARAEGVLERLALDRERYVLHLEHEAHETGRDFDPESVAGEGPFAVYRLRGLGAEICR
jgi:hypothetical protein